MKLHKFSDCSACPISSFTHFPFVFNFVLIIVKGRRTGERQLAEQPWDEDFGGPWQPMVQISTLIWLLIIISCSWAAPSCCESWIRSLPEFRSLNRDSCVLSAVFTHHAPKSMQAMIFAFYRLRHIFTFWRGKPCLGSCCVRLLFSKSFACYYYFTLPSFLLPRFSFICPFWFGFIFTVARPAAFINNSHLFLSFPLALMLMSSQLVRSTGDPIEGVLSSEGAWQSHWSRYAHILMLGYDSRCVLQRGLQIYAFCTVWNWLSSGILQIRWIPREKALMPWLHQSGWKMCE